LQAWPEPVNHIHDLSLSFVINEQNLILEDWLGGLRRNAEGQLAQILYRPNAICTDKQPKWHTLISAWLNHLAAGAQGLAVQTFVVGADTCLSWPPLAAPQAQQHLQELVSAWYLNCQQPLPLACKTGFAWLEKIADSPEKAISAAQACYLGGFASSGEVSNPYLARAYPDFADLYSESFRHYAQLLYAPMMTALHNQT